MSATEIIKKIKAALLERDPWVNKDPVVAALFRELEEIVVWDHILCPAETELPKDDAHESTAVLLAGLTLEDHSTKPQPDHSTSKRNCIRHDSIDLPRPWAKKYDTTYVAIVEVEPRLNLVRDIDPSKWSYFCGFVDPEKKRDPHYYNVAKYATFTGADLGLCLYAYEYRQQCPKGSACLWRHHPLLDHEVAHPRMRSLYKTLLREKYMAQDCIVTKWDSFSLMA